MNNRFSEPGLVAEMFMQGKTVLQSRIFFCSVAGTKSETSNFIEGFQSETKNSWFRSFGIFPKHEKPNTLKSQPSQFLTVFQKISVKTVLA